MADMSQKLESRLDHRMFTDGAYMTEEGARGMADWYRRSRAVGASDAVVVLFDRAWWVVYHAARPFTDWHDNPVRLSQIIDETNKRRTP